MNWLHWTGFITQCKWLVPASWYYKSYVIFIQWSSKGFDLWINISLKRTIWCEIQADKSIDRDSYVTGHCGMTLISTADLEHQTEISKVLKKDLDKLSQYISTCIKLENFFTKYKNVLDSQGKSLLFYWGKGRKRWRYF